MPRYDDRYGGNTRLYVGKLAPRTRSRDLEYIFSKYGRIREVEMKRDYAFIEFSDARDADEAQYQLDGRDVDGSRIIVEFAKGELFTVPVSAPWEGPQSELQQKQKPRSRSRSLSGSPRGGRRDQRRSRSLSYSRSPRRSASPPAKERSRTPDGSRSPRSPSPRDRVSPPPKDNVERNGSDHGDSPRGRGESRSRSPSDGGRSPAANGRSPSPRDNRSQSPRDNRSPSPMDNGNGDDEDRGASPRGSSLHDFTKRRRLGPQI
ncbi:hypothetical protein EJB05_34257 [Eragrostis curvula]|uniref:RRM domain-containing protein n=1 Tax=Eragrostis curvula TaxID=38414 RepID=A0A5J9U4K5_9POAL|nr:hypothetical protein EJB05_34257 [Eragrostis curvula]